MYPNDENDNMIIDELEEYMIDDIEEFEEIEDEDVEEVEDVLIGTVSGCSRLNVRFRPNSKADIVCEIDNNTEVMIDESESTDEFYKVYIASGIEGYCMKKYIDVQP